MRRSIAVEVESEAPVEFGGLRLDPRSRTVSVAEKGVSLTAKEFDLLWFLMRHPRQVFKRQQLLDKVWGYEFYGDESTVTVHVRRLREKLEPNPSKPSYIQTVLGCRLQIRDSRLMKQKAPTMVRIDERLTRNPLLIFVIVLVIPIAGTLFSELVMFDLPGNEVQQLVAFMTVTGITSSLLSYAFYRLGCARMVSQLALGDLDGDRVAGADDLPQCLGDRALHLHPKPLSHADFCPAGFCRAYRH